jgi:hypothetical protein
MSSAKTISTRSEPTPPRGLLGTEFNRRLMIGQLVIAPSGFGHRQRRPCQTKMTTFPNRCSGSTSSRAEAAQGAPGATSRVSRPPSDIYPSSRCNECLRPTPITRTLPVPSITFTNLDLVLTAGAIAQIGNPLPIVAEVVDRRTSSQPPGPANGYPRPPPTRGVNPR